VSVCVRLPQVGVLSKRMNESSWFRHVSFFPPVLHCVKRKFGYLQNKGTSLRNFVLNSGHRKFRHGISIVETCYQLSSRKVDAHSVINWAVVGQLSRQYLRAPTPDHYSLSHRSSSTVYSTICRTGQLATADTWFRTCRTSSFCTVAWHLARFLAKCQDFN